ncbi:hypothetical protein HOP50_05g36990 [Chloropicon primus]|uniref:Uncharacterized protein n=2 Tax=Chloropicon primus TaxID=1764295 RepID=A0A5B8ML43_9CHLO|nr:hypothetical protein A3770_05p36910 [Chloropicon primus]UPR00385.1 hypothetical protein HOP50_05g36990 [Chloropicon primus]|eukprot:QDZ21173.1 hypothetical protein A3770_05p36910 [Chloropicon primus]
MATVVRTEDDVAGKDASSKPLQLPRQIERKLEMRATALRRSRRRVVVLEGNARDDADVVVVADDVEGGELSERLARAEQLRQSLLEERSKRARRLSFENVERARERRARERIKQCFLEAARAARVRLARKRRKSEIEELMRRAAAKNARVHSVRDAVRAKESEERVSREKALACRLRLAERRRGENLRRSPRSPKSAALASRSGGGPRREAAACVLIQRRWREAREVRAARLFAAAVPKWFLARAGAAASGGEDLPTPEGVDRDYLAYKRFEECSAVVRRPSVLRATSCLLQRVAQRGGSPPPGNPAREARTFLAAFMIVLHPEIVMSRKLKAVEEVLQEESSALVRAFLDEVVAERKGNRAEEFEGRLRSHRAAFETWKKDDAAALEGDLIKMARDLTASVLAKCGPDLEARHVTSNPDLRAMVEALGNDRRLLTSKVKSLAGVEGVQRMEEAVRSCVAEFEEEYRRKVSERGRESGGGDGDGADDAVSGAERLECAFRAAMADLIRESVEKGEYDHVLRLWDEVRDRLMRLSGSSPRERERTAQCIDCDYARELVKDRAMDSSILADMMQLASRRIGELGAAAYERETLEWGLLSAQLMRESESAGSVLAQFFQDADVLLTRIEAGIAASLLCQALTSGASKEMAS